MVTGALIVSTGYLLLGLSLRLVQACDRLLIPLGQLVWPSLTSVSCSYRHKGPDGSAMLCPAQHLNVRPIAKIGQECQ